MLKLGPFASVSNFTIGSACALLVVLPDNIGIFRAYKLVGPQRGPCRVYFSTSKLGEWRHAPRKILRNNETLQNLVTVLLTRT